MKHHSTIGIKQNSNKTGRNRRGQQLSAIELMKENSALYDRLTKVEAHFIELESKLFESSSRTGYAELRAGRADVRAIEVERRAGEAESWAAKAKQIAERAESRAAEAENSAAKANDHATEADRKSAEAESSAAKANDHATEADRKSTEAERVANATEVRCVRLEEKWQRITSVIKKVLYIPRVANRFYHRIKNKTIAMRNSVSSTSEESVKPTHTEEDASVDQTKPTKTSPRSNQVYRNLERSIEQKRSQEKCE